MRKRVYIAGPISKGVVALNVSRATRVAVELIARGFAPLCPQLSTFLGYHEDGDFWQSPHASPCSIPHATWLEVDMPWVDVSDAVLRLEGESVGADAGVARAKSRGIPVFATIAEIEQHFAKPAVAIEAFDPREERREQFTTPAVHFETGAAKYGDRNWERGQPIQRYIDSALRHMFNYQEGRRDEDHLIAAAWNLLAAVTTEERVRAGKLPEGLLNDACK